MTIGSTSLKCKTTCVWKSSFACNQRIKLNSKRKTQTCHVIIYCMCKIIIFFLNPVNYFIVSFFAIFFYGIAIPKKIILYAKYLKTFQLKYYLY